MINEDAYEDYCMEKMRLEEILSEIEEDIHVMHEGISDLESDLASVQEELDNLSVEDFMYE